MRLVPPADQVIGADDRLVVLAEDHGSARAGAPVPVDATAIRGAEPCDAEPERTLLLGWNRRGAAIIRELDQYVAPGSEVLAVSSLESVLQADAIEGLVNLRATGQVQSTTQRPSLDALDVPSFPHVIVLCESDDRDPDMADARTLLTLLHLRDIGSRSDKAFTIVSEMLDEGDRELAEVSEADDFIVSSRLLSLLLAQIAETPDLADVFRELFKAEGAEVYLREVRDYVALGRPVSLRNAPGRGARTRRGCPGLPARRQREGCRSPVRGRAQPDPRGRAGVRGGGPRGGACRAVGRSPAAVGRTAGRPRSGPW